MVAIIGDGGHALALAAWWLKNAGVSAKCYGKDDKLPTDSHFLIGIGNKPRHGDSDLKRRAELFEKHREWVVGLTLSECFAVPLWNVNLSLGIQTMPRSFVNYGAKIGNNVLINTGAIVEHDCVVGDHCHIAPGAILCGNVTVGALTHIGAGAVIKQGITIGSNCVVGMGAVVRRDLSDSMTVY